MHPTGLPKYAVDGAIRRRGRLHAIESLNPARTALVVIDMQNVFLQEGSPAETPMARAIVPNINRLADVVRSRGGPVAWVQMTHDKSDLDSWSVFYDNIFGPERTPTINAWLSKGHEGQALWPDLDVRDDDLIVEKNRFSAFLPGSSNIAELLSGRGIDTVLITGTLTHVCSESSARDAMMMNYKAVMVSDANAAPADEEHIASLASFVQVFGDVYSTDEVIDLLNARKSEDAAE
ncbi:MAG: cysteine hydrolase [Rhodospirillales bacterium]|nr:cysteine hydrolase [Rhodospirillales bacterium]